MNGSKPLAARGTPWNWNLRHVTKLAQGDHDDLVGTLAACALAKRHAVVVTPTSLEDPTANAILEIATQLFQASAVRIHLPLTATAAASHLPSATPPLHSPTSNASLAAIGGGRSNPITTSSASFANQFQNDDHMPLLSANANANDPHRRSFEPFPSLNPTNTNRLFQSQLIIHNSAPDPLIPRTSRHATMDSISAAAAANHSAASAASTSGSGSVSNNTLLRRRLISLPGGGNGSFARSTTQQQTTQSHRRSLVDPLGANPASAQATSAATSIPVGKRVANVAVLVLGEKLDVHVQAAMLEVMHSGHVNDGRHLVPLPSAAAKNGGLFMWVVVVPYRVGERVPRVGMRAELMTHFLFSTTLTTAPPSPLFPSPLPAHLHLTPTLVASLLAHPEPAPIHMHIRRYLHDVLVSLRTAFPTVPIAANLVSEWILALKVVCHPSMYGGDTSVVTPEVVQWVVGRVVVHRIVMGTVGLGGGGRGVAKRKRDMGMESVEEVVERVARAVERVEVPV